jgi:DNA-binding NarL/FixJ family response regulator
MIIIMKRPILLIADDSDAKQMLLEGFLMRSHWKVKILKAFSTEKAMRLIKKHPDIGFAFVDYQIPSEEGPAVITYLKKTNPAARIALVTASDSTRYESEARAAGAEAFLCTTHGEEETAANITELLKGWQRAA